ncbi:MAG: YbjN domain-containing protein [Actinobacteria bacterium]|nr:YbjN domain-containing protein [Actinomycetota bacterium]
MPFETEAQKNVYEMIVPWMKEIWGELARFPEDQPVIVVDVGSTLALVVVFPWGEDEAVIETRAMVTKGTELTPDLLRYLLENNERMRFGSFAVGSNGEIFFIHSIVGSTCDKNELRASTRAVVSTADEYDDKIVQRWGGKRMSD